MNKLGIAVIGCGAISKNHGEAVLKSSSAELLYGMDIILEKARAFSDRYGGIPLDNYHQVLADPRVDVVHICTPHHTHTQLALEAMRCGKHVFCEKPMAIEPADAKKMIEEAEKNRCYLGVCFQNRMNATTVLAKNKIDSGEFGGLLSAMARVAWDRHGKYYSQSSWRGRYATEGGGVIINQAIHTIDLLDYLCGGVDSVTAIATRLRDTDDYEVDDSCMANFRFKNGSTAVGHFTNCYTCGKLAQIEMVFEKAKIILDNHRLEIIRDSGTEVTLAEQAKGEKSEWGLSHSLLIRQFYDCILEKKPFFVDGQSGIRALLIVDAIRKSNGHPVQI